MTEFQRVSALLFLLTTIPFAADGNGPSPEPCSKAWYEHVESRVTTGDGAGHGPDLGSEEWKHVVEFRLGIREDPQVPDVSSPKWCDYVDGLLKQDPI